MDQFEEWLAGNLRFRVFFEDNFILSIIFEYNYSERCFGKWEDYLMMFVFVELVGNLSYGIVCLLFLDGFIFYQLLGMFFVQFLRVDVGI